MENNEGMEIEEPEIEETEPSEADKQTADLKNELALARADLYNYRQRMDKERAKLRNMVSEERISDFIPILDNLDRALNVSEDATAADILKGVRMVQRQFLGVLADLGVEPISASEGSPFDPALHDAMGTDETESPELDGKVTNLLLPGYRTKEKILRPAKVRVGRVIENE